MLDSGLYDPDTGEWLQWCPRCGGVPVRAGLWCTECTDAYRRENEALDSDYSLIRDEEIADEGYETTVEASEDAA